MSWTNKKLRCNKSMLIVFNASKGRKNTWPPNWTTSSNLPKPKITNSRIKLMSWRKKISCYKSKLIPYRSLLMKWNKDFKLKSMLRNTKWRSSKKLWMKKASLWSSKMNVSKGWLKSLNLKKLMWMPSTKGNFHNHFKI